jgi:G patch domain-containing protein 1
MRQSQRGTMGADSDSDDYVLVGTPIEQAAARHKAAAGGPAGAAVSRAPPVWQQEATDEQGRRRFHGAFTGGFSAGYYNTVGSKEGWAPSSFVSSRGARAGAGEAAKPDARAFMDEDEQLELDARRNAVGTRAEFDTAKALAEAQSTAEVHRAVLDGARPSVLPGPVPTDLVIVPVKESIGTRLLRAMGWRPGGAQPRRGRGSARGPASAELAVPRVQAALSALAAGEEAVLAGEEAEAHDAALFGVTVPEDCPPEMAIDDEGDDSAAAAAERMRRRRRRWGALAGALADDADVEFPVAKLDTHGLGYDPFSGAEEFRAIKRRRQDETGQQQQQGGRGGGRPSALRERGTAFGVGVFEAMDDDIYGDGEPKGRRMLMSLPTVADEDGSDEDQGPGRRAAVLPALGSGPERLALKAPPPRDRGAFGLDGFVRASTTEAPQKHYPPPVVPREFKPVHVFAQPHTDVARSAAAPGKPAVPPDAELVRRCDTLAAFVARNGPGFEALARQRQAKDPRFSFLFNGPGSEYYAWKKATLCNEAAPAPRPEQRSRPLTAVERGHMLGEEPLAPGQQAASTATAPAVIPSRDSVAQARARGIADSDRAALLSSMGRTFVKEDSAAVAQAPPPQYGLQLSANRFATGGIEMGGQPVAGAAQPAPTGGQAAAAATAADLPPVQRSVDDWGPEPLLCKRYGVPDPYKGRQRPAERRTFRTDTLALPATAQAEVEAAPKFLGVVPASSDKQAPTPEAGAPPATKERSDPRRQEAADEADDFFASMALPVTGDAPPGLDAGVVVPVASVPAMADKPMDLFKAIFEASDDEEEDDAGDDAEVDVAPPEGARMPNTQHGAAAHDAALPPQPTLPPAPLSALATALAFAKELRAAKRKSKKAEKERSKHKHKKSRRERKRRAREEKLKKYRRNSRSRSGRHSSDTSSSPDIQ